MNSSREEALFALALEKSADQRPAFLDAMCDGDAALRARLDALIATHVKALLEAGKFSEAEPLARECVALREKLIPDEWFTFNARSMLGACLLGQKKFAEAEPLLLAGYEGLKQREDRISAAGKSRPKEAAERIVQLYEATGQTAKAVEWKKTLEGLNAASR